MISVGIGQLTALMPGKSEDQLSHTPVSELLSNKELFIKDSGPVSVVGWATVGCQFW